MLDAIADLLTTNETVRYDVIFGIVIAYFVFLWLVVCIWVFNDARKRYGKLALAFVWTVLVFFLNIPVLILYMLLRPEEDLWSADMAAEYTALNVPVINFVDENGVHLSLELKIHQGAARNPDMKVDVSLAGQTKQVSLDQPNLDNKTSAIKLPEFGKFLQRLKMPSRPAKTVEPKAEQVVEKSVELTPLVSNVTEATIDSNQPKVEEQVAATAVSSQAEVIANVVEHVETATQQLEQNEGSAIVVETQSDQAVVDQTQNSFNYRRNKKRRRR